jgi:hypothetical protein
MDPRREVLSEAFNRFLDRYAPPMHMRNSPDTMQAEADALFRMVMKFAPVTGYETWLDEVLEQLSYQMKTRAWPTVHEVGAAARNVSKTRPSAANASDKPAVDPLQRYANRIKAGEPVGDGYLYGRNAVEMLERGLISEAELRPYRSALFFSMKDVWGEAAARAKEAEFIRRHEMAGHTFTGGNGYSAEVKPKRAPISQDQADEYRAGGWG